MRRNFTSVTEFILLGLTNRLELQIDSPLPAASGHLHGHRGRESGDDCTHPGQFQTPHDHVLYPKPLILCGSVLLFQHNPKDAGAFLVREENHFLLYLSGAVLPLYCFGSCGALYSGCDGL